MPKRRYQVHGQGLTIHPGMIFSGTDFSGADLRGADFSKCRLIGADFSGANLAGANFRSASVYVKTRQGNTQGVSTFAGADLTNTHFANAEIKDTDLSAADLTGAIFRTTNFRRVILAGASLKNSRGTLVFDKVKAPGVDMSFTKYSSVVITNSDLRGANLCDAHWRGVRIYDSDLSGATALRAHLDHPRLDRCDLSTADLRGLIAPRLRMRSGRLNRSNLSGATLTGSYLHHVHMGGLNLSQTDMSNSEIVNPPSLPGFIKGIDLSNVLWPNFDDAFAGLPPDAAHWALGEGKRLRRSLDYLIEHHPGHQRVLSVLYNEHRAASATTLVSLAHALKSYDPPATAGSNDISLKPLVGAASVPR